MAATPYVCPEGLLRPYTTAMRSATTYLAFLALHLLHIINHGLVTRIASRRLQRQHRGASSETGP